MILSIIVAIFSILGIYGFYSSNVIFLYIGMGAVLIEHIVDLYSGEKKKFFSTCLALCFAFGMIIAGINWIQSIAVCLCFEYLIFSILSLLFLIKTLFVIKKDNSPSQDSTIMELMKKSNLSKSICTDIFNILTLFENDKAEDAYTKIQTDLIPDLKIEKKYSNVGIAFGMLINDKALTKEEAITYTNLISKEIINEN